MKKLALLGTVALAFAATPALGQAGVNIMEFCKAFNARTQQPELAGLVVPIVLTVYQDRSYVFITKTPPAAVLILKTAKLAKGSGEPNRNKVGKLTEAQVEEIAKQKMPDLNCHTIESAMACIRGTARSMGVEIV